MTILVTGATGTVGRHIVAQLMQQGHAVRALTRNPSRANLPAGVEVVGGDLAVPESLGATFDGVTAMHLINFDSGSGQLLASGEQLLALAQQAGVRRITLLRGGQQGTLERAIETSTLEWTYLAPVEFMAGLLDWADSIRAEGVVRVPFVSRRSAMIDEADIGAVAAAVLVNGGYGGASLTLTGPEVLTPPEMLRTIGDAIGRELHLIELSEAEARAGWKAAGYPDAVIEFFVWAHGSTPEVGYTVTPTVEQVTGRPPRRLTEWAAAHAQLFR